jgi:hypothetical protein
MPHKVHHHLTAANLSIGTSAPEFRPEAAQPRTPRQRKPNLATAIKLARKAGVNVSGAVFETDGRLSLTFGESNNANGSSTLDDWVLKHARQT